MSFVKQSGMYKNSSGFFKISTSIHFFFYPYRVDFIHSEFYASTIGILLLYITQVYFCCFRYIVECRCIGILLLRRKHKLGIQQETLRFNEAILGLLSTLF